MVAVFIGCEKTDNKADYGFTNIFLPQATFSGGTNLNFPVPSGLDSATRNYKIDPNKVNVLLGVQRTGTQALDAFEVTVTTNADTVNQLIANGNIKVDPDKAKAVVLLPSTAYTLPTTVSVPAGQSSALFKMAIDRAILKTYAGKKVAVAVVLSNTTKYSINKALNKVIVLINVDALGL